jgi:hypothetical protein
MWMGKLPAWGASPTTAVSAIHYAPNAANFLVTWRRS